MEQTLISRGRLNRTTIKEQTVTKVALWKYLIPIIIFLFDLMVLPMIIVSLGLKYNTTGFTIATTITKVVSAAAIFYTCKKFGIKVFEKVTFRWYYIVFAILAAFLNIAKGGLLTAIFGGNGTTANGAGLISLMGANLLYFVFYTAIYAPIMEEVIFRGIIMKNIFAKNQWIGLAVSSILFCALHTPTDLFSFFNYFITGLLFGAVFMLTKSVKWSIASHIINNSISVFFMILLMMTGMM